MPHPPRSPSRPSRGTVGQDGAGSSVTAPGKLMVCGEYAVLQGAEAVVAAVNRRARVTCDKEGRREGELPPEVTHTRALAEKQLGPLPGSLKLDVSELRSGGQKLGLGSSAAAAAAAAGVVYAYHGRHLRDEATRREILSVALEGHRAVAPSGSGADVAAATLGGFVGVQVRSGKTGPASQLRTRALRLPAALQISVVWMGQAARTSDLVSQVRELAEQRPRLHDELMSELGLQARHFVTSAENDDAVELLAAADAYGRGMQALGEAAGAPIVTPALRELAQRARNLGGAAKPSGAGGGDVALGFFTAAEARHQFEIGCRERNLTILSLGLGAEGVRDEAR